MVYVQAPHFCTLQPYNLYVNPVIWTLNPVLTCSLTYLSTDCHRAVAAAEEAEEAAVLQPEESTILQPEETLLLHLLKTEGDTQRDS